MDNATYRGLTARDCGETPISATIARCCRYLTNPMTVKGQILKALCDLPDDATIEDAIYCLKLLEKIDRALAQAATGDVLGQDIVRRRLALLLAGHSVDG